MAPLPRSLLLDDVTVQATSVFGTRVADLPAGGTGYAIVSVELMHAIILTYDCDIDRGLENIVSGNEPDQLELITVAAVYQPAGTLLERVSNINAGGMPRYAYLPATTKNVGLIIDFAYVQQVGLRVLVPLAADGRIYGLRNPHGQLRLLERFAHALGDPVRRQQPAGDPGDPTLFARAASYLSPPNTN